MANAEKGESSAGVVAIFAIVLMVALAGFIAWRMGAFGGSGGNTHHSLDINLNNH